MLSLPNPPPLIYLAQTNNEVTTTGPELVTTLNPPCIFHRLPDELQIKILGYLVVKDLLKVTEVCHKWYTLVYEGSLWKTLDIAPFYKTIPSDQLLKLGLAAGKFLKIANFRGCSQLTSHMLRVLSEHCVNVESLYLKDCRKISTPSLACFLQNATSLTLLDLSGLECVKNSTLKVIGQSLPHLEKLNLSWCKNITGEGIQQLVYNGGKCHSIEILKLNGAGLMDEMTMGILASHLPKLRQLSLASCTTLTDAAFAHLLKSSQQQWTHLNISNCSRLNDRSLKQLALHGGNQLTHLELAGCHAFTDTGMTFLAARLHSLVYLDLEDLIQLTGITIKALANNQPNLKRLCLSNCSHIDDEAILHLVLNGVCRYLDHLELDGCTITDNCLDAIATYLVNQYQERQRKRQRYEDNRQSASLDLGSSADVIYAGALSMSTSSSSFMPSPSITVTTPTSINTRESMVMIVDGDGSSPALCNQDGYDNSRRNSNDSDDTIAGSEGYQYNKDDDNNDDNNNNIQPTRTMTMEVLDCGDISEAGVRSALTKAGPFLDIKSFYSWRDGQWYDDNTNSAPRSHSETRRQRQHHHQHQQYPSAVRHRNGGRHNRHLTAGQSHSSGCVIL
ncbi:hypothetical protein BC941DRAFT_443199 [Chlamydoabsidia padenii]|nr:hypothetical protein BC941DRAFT_443199 [Chlamydoabsidia padenii]